MLRFCFCVENNLKTWLRPTESPRRILEGSGIRAASQFHLPPSTWFFFPSSHVEVSKSEHLVKSVLKKKFSRILFWENTKRRHFAGCSRGGVKGQGSRPCCNPSMPQWVATLQTSCRLDGGANNKGNGPTHPAGLFVFCLQPVYLETPAPTHPTLHCTALHRQEDD